MVQSIPKVCRQSHRVRYFKSQAGIKCLGNDTAIFFWSSCGASWADYKFPGNYSHINKNKYRCVVTKNRVYSKGVCSAPYSLRDPGEGPSHKAK